MKKIIFIILISIMIAPSVLAQYQLIEPLPIPGLQEGPVTLTSYIGGAIKIAIIIAALLAVVVIVIAGFMYIMAGGNPGKIEKAKDMIWNAIIGLLIALSFYIILYAINPNMLNEIEITPVDVRQAQLRQPQPSVFLQGGDSGGVGAGGGF